MTTAVLSVASPEYTPLLDVAAPSFRRFADFHGYDLALYRNAEAPEDRHPAWNKVNLLLGALDYCSRVILLDCDLVIVKPEAVFPWDDMGDASHALFIETLPDGGLCPNTGVIGATRAMIPLLEQMWEHPETRWHTEPWWEQSAYMQIQGYDPTVTPCTGPATPPANCHDIGIDWNCPWVYRDRDPVIWHAGGIPGIEQRRGVMESLCVS